MKTLSVLIVNYNTSRFIQSALVALQLLTKNSYKVYILDNGSKLKDYEYLQRICNGYPNVTLYRETTDLRGSMAHGTALNTLVEMVDTPYFSILDSDAVWLRKNWDQLLIDRLIDNVKVIGTQAPPAKPQDFPLMFAILFETATFKKLNIDFRPNNNNLKEDTGHEIRSKYLRAGYKGVNITYHNTRTFTQGPFSDIICGEYYLGKDLLASHFGRGSSMGLAKYNKGLTRFIYRIPVFGKFYLRKKGANEISQWLKKCKEIVQQQIGPSDDHYEQLENCPYCHSVNHDIVLSSVDRLAGKPGVFYLSECNQCHLVFQNPRIKEEYIGMYYSDDIGYCRVPVSAGDSNHHVLYTIKYWIKNRLPQRFKNKYYILKAMPNGNLLEIGCSDGQRLANYQMQGWQVTGIEMHQPTAEHAKKNHQLDVVNKKIEAVDFPDNQFNAIVMKMVLEHLYHPFDTLKKITRWLKPGGKLIFSIPYYNGFEFKLHNEYSYGLQLPTHITFFTKKILSDYLTKLGYHSIRFDFDYSDRDFIAPWHYKYLETNKVFHKFLAYNKIYRMLLVKPIIFLLALLSLTSRVTVSAIKK